MLRSLFLLLVGCATGVTAAATELGLCRATIYRRMKRYGIVPPNLM